MNSLRASGDVYSILIIWWHSGVALFRPILRRFKWWGLWFQTHRRKLPKISIFCGLMTGAMLFDVSPPGRSTGHHTYIDATYAVDLCDHSRYPSWLPVISRSKTPCITKCSNLVPLNWVCCFHPLGLGGLCGLLSLSHVCRLSPQSINFSSDLSSIE